MMRLYRISNSFRRLLGFGAERRTEDDKHAVYLRVFHARLNRCLELGRRCIRKKIDRVFGPLIRNTVLRVLYGFGTHPG